MSTPPPFVRLPFVPLPSGFGAKAEPEIHALLKSGQVLAFSLQYTTTTHGYASPPSIHVALPCPKKGMRWISAPTDIRAQEATIPGLTYAVMALHQCCTDTHKPRQVFAGWKQARGHAAGPDAEVDLTLLADGFSIGIAQPKGISPSMHAHLEGAQHKVWACLGIPLPEAEAISAHLQVRLLPQVKRLFQQWARVYPAWNRTLPFAAPQHEAIMEAIGAR